MDNIEAITPEKLASIAPIDLVVGGSPCVELNPSLNRKGYLGKFNLSCFKLNFSLNCLTFVNSYLLVFLLLK